RVPPGAARGGGVEGAPHLYEAEPLEPPHVRSHLPAGAEIRDAGMELRPLALPAGEGAEDRVVTRGRLEVPLDPLCGQVGEGAVRLEEELADVGVEPDLGIDRAQHGGNAS